MKYLLVFFSILLLLIGVSCAQGNDELISLFPIENYDQAVARWINPTANDYDQPLLSEEKSKQHLDFFYNHYFGNLSPWNMGYVNKILQQSDSDSVKAIEANVIANFNNEGKPASQIGYGENFRPHTKAWIDAIAENMNVAQFNSLTYQSNQRAIAIDNLHARVLPTEDMYLYHHTLPGEGFPFDNLQMSALWVGTPLYILGETRDHEWSLVVTPDYIAWVKSIGIARVSDRFVATWSNTAKNHLSAITQTKTSVITKNGDFLFTANVGAVFPAKDTNGLIILVPAVDHHQAVIEHATLAAHQVALMPLKATPHHFANIIGTLIGRPYGWGSMYFYNDCSAELKSLLTPFGIWLPRHSSQQVTIGKMVDMSSATPEQRVTYLKENGQRFLTIIYIGGHVVLYIGNDNNNAMLYENMWGLSPNPPSRRAVVGQSVFLPLLLQFPEDVTLTSQAGKKYFQVAYLGELISNDYVGFSIGKKSIDLRTLIFPDTMQ